MFRCGNAEIVIEHAARNLPDGLKADSDQSVVGIVVEIIELATDKVPIEAVARCDGAGPKSGGRSRRYTSKPPVSNIATGITCSISARFSIEFIPGTSGRYVLEKFSCLACRGAPARRTWVSAICGTRFDPNQQMIEILPVQFLHASTLTGAPNRLQRNTTKSE